MRIKTRSGGDLTGTPNHPILTDRGWVPLGELTEGDYVVRDMTDIKGMAPRHPDPQRPSPRVDQVHRFAAKNGVLHRVAGAPGDFHGDGTESDVDVVWTDRLLRNGREATATKFISDQSLALADVRAVLLANEGPELGFGRSDHPSAHRGMGGSRETLALLDRQASHPDRGMFGGGAQMNTGAAQSVIDDGAADIMEFSERVERFASLVVADEIIGVEWMPFAGHVYNLETSDGWYTANGMIAHNCRCVLVAVQPKRNVDDDADDAATLTGMRATR